MRIEKKILNFINNEWCEPTTGKYLENLNPATGQMISEIADSSSQDIDRAVTAAKSSFLSWSNMPAERRSQWLYKIADEIEKHLEEFAELESLDQGKPVKLAREMDIPRAVANFRFFAGAILHSANLASEMDGQALNYTLRKPVGVAGLISPWNLPLYLLTWKIAPALACGNSVICKPSEFTSMTAARLCKLLQDIQFPAGVVNMVFGLGTRAGDALVRHPEVPLISFTGGTATGRKVIEASAENFKKLSLELGGKNPNIIFADCDYARMLESTVRSSFLNQGEICLCGSRIYVQESLYEKFIADFVTATKKLVVGDPAQEKTFMGPLISKAHQEKVLQYCKLAKDEGGTILCGGEAAKVSGFAGGYFVSPTVIANLPENSRCIQEEIFGPVVTVSTFRNLAEVTEKANAVKYGLSATVWTQDISQAHTLARDLRVGTVWVNSWLLRDLRAPFGGMKASGLGREGGEHSLDFYSELTTVCVRY
jgi:aminomuconate-semialdehyde/2-hydroxymuconate-6-semialdehyde dehydrogenase